MYDRPTAAELLAAARGHLETHIVPAVKGDGKLYFQTLVAVNVLRVVERELGLSFAHAEAEWARLNALEGIETPLPAAPAARAEAFAARNAALCAAIRAGEYDAPEQDTRLFDHLLQTTLEQLQVANPKLLETLAAEERAG